MTKPVQIHKRERRAAKPWGNSSIKTSSKRVTGRSGRGAISVCNPRDERQKQRRRKEGLKRKENERPRQSKKNMH